MADILNLLTLFEGRETEEADKAWTSDVRSWLSRLQASESRSTSDAAAVQTTWSYQGSKFTACLNGAVH